MVGLQSQLVIWFLTYYTDLVPLGESADTLVVMPVQHMEVNILFLKKKNSVGKTVHPKNRQQRQTKWQGNWL